MSGIYVFLKNTLNDAPLTLDKTKYPYKFYEITLKRGLIGLKPETKKAAKSLGLLKRFQVYLYLLKVVHRRVEPRFAGLILRLKELISVRLVNSVPVAQPTPTGFVKIGSYLN